ncbi:MAG: hypothetical protein KF889_04805 [Alphaproteobacteria bacterium]|nr:hypothetical protein [Alphaproteobacteria bacterium]MCW5742187.1 hypothetical protein [Alphaproteobacteria bacterium]
MKIKEVRDVDHVRQFGEKSDRTVQVAILNKWSEPTALFRAWLALPQSVLTTSSVFENLFTSMSRGKDPYLSTLVAFLDVCREHDVPVMVRSRNYGERPFEVQENGSAYTPQSAESPFRKGRPCARQPGESEESFFERWDEHRLGCFSLCVHDVFDELGTTLGDYLVSQRPDHDMSRAIPLELFDARLMAQWVLNRPEAARLARTAEPSVDRDRLPVVETTSAPVIDDGRVSQLEATVAELSARLATLSSPTRINLIGFPTITAPEPTPSNVVVLRPRWSEPTTYEDAYGLSETRRNVA